MSFSDNSYDCSNNEDINTTGNHIIILKRIKSLRQLRRTEKELVRLNYKEAIIKGFTLKGIQHYIASKTKIWIEWSCLEFLKKLEEQENKEWYLRLAKDHFAYIGIHRDIIDEIQQIKNELWKIVMNNKSEPSAKTAAIKEIHNIAKTKVLLLRDLPFIMNLSKYYDPAILDPNNNSLSQLGKASLRDSQIHHQDRTSLHNTERIEGIEKHHTSLVFSTLERIESKHNMSDELTRKLREQTMNIPDPNDIPLPIELEEQQQEE